MVRLIECAVTWQGEGPNTGQRMLLTRFKHCNKNCSYCDTQVKMRTTLESDFSLSTIQDVINKEKLGIMITGGEPTIKRHFDDTVNMLNKLTYTRANVESNGFDLDRLIKEVLKSKPVNYIFSPKIFNEKDFDECVEIFNMISSFDSVYYKIVYQNNFYVKEFLNYIESKGVNDRVYLMPQGRTREELINNSPEVFDVAEAYKINFSSRDHLIYSFI